MKPTYFPELLPTITVVVLSASSVLADVDGINVNFDVTDLKTIDQGKAIYAENCAACHGDNLEGQDNWKKPDSDDRLPAPPHDENGHTWHHADDLLFEITKFGLARMIDDPSYETNMPIYEGVLSDDEITAALTFIKSTWAGDTKSWNDRVNLQANEYWVASPTVKSLDELQGNVNPDAQ
ncbi:MAG: c-type cytochrome [Alphaproteobacteria bacterium]